MGHFLLQCGLNPLDDQFALMGRRIDNHHSILELTDHLRVPRRVVEDQVM